MDDTRKFNLKHHGMRKQVCTRKIIDQKPASRITYKKKKEI